MTGKFFIVQFGQTKIQNVLAHNLTFFPPGCLEYCQGRQETEQSRLTRTKNKICWYNCIRGPVSEGPASIRWPEHRISALTTQWPPLADVSPDNLLTPHSLPTREDTGALSPDSPIIIHSHCRKNGRLMDPSPILETIYLHMSIIQTYRLGLGNKSVFDSSFVSLFSEEMKSNGNGNQVGKKILFWINTAQHYLPSTKKKYYYTFFNNMHCKMWIQIKAMLVILFVPSALGNPPLRIISSIIR